VQGPHLYRAQEIEARLFRGHQQRFVRHHQLEMAHSELLVVADHGLFVLAVLIDDLVARDAWRMFDEALRLVLAHRRHLQFADLLIDICLSASSTWMAARDAVLNPQFEETPRVTAAEIIVLLLVLIGWIAINPGAQRAVILLQLVQPC
jgi:hypothetical protein